jgi:hypothetical protein
MFILPRLALAAVIFASSCACLASPTPGPQSSTTVNDDDESINKIPPVIYRAPTGAEFSAPGSHVMVLGAGAWYYFHQLGDTGRAIVNYYRATARLSPGLRAVFDSLTGEEKDQYHECFHEYERVSHASARRIEKNTKPSLFSCCLFFDLNASHRLSDLFLCGET